MKLTPNKLVKITDIEFATISYVRLSRHRAFSIYFTLSVEIEIGLLRRASTFVLPVKVLGGTQRFVRILPFPRFVRLNSSHDGRKTGHIRIVVTRIIYVLSNQALDQKLKTTQSRAQRKTFPFETSVLPETEVTYRNFRIVDHEQSGFVCDT